MFTARLLPLQAENRADSAERTVAKLERTVDEMEGAVRPQTNDRPTDRPACHDVTLTHFLRVRRIAGGSQVGQPGTPCHAQPDHGGAQCLLNIPHPFTFTSGINNQCALDFFFVFCFFLRSLCGHVLGREQPIRFFCQTYGANLRSDTPPCSAAAIARLRP